MTQREVGERLVATPGSKIYGAPTVLAAYFSEAQIAGRVSRRAFWPIPGVDSVILRFTRKRQLPEVPYELVQKVVRDAFSQRRKTLRNTLAGTFGSQTPAETVLAEAGIEASARAEEIGLDGFISLARALLQD
jgi:16S rRNA (adenine1518-N6/adenine1519-N6)-dimethyltransferase